MAEISDIRFCPGPNGSITVTVTTTVTAPAACPPVAGSSRTVQLKSGENPSVDLLLAPTCAGSYEFSVTVSQGGAPLVPPASASLTVR